MLKNKYNKGFTLIEIVAILILIGILMAVAASKYFDMRDEAQKRAALATVAEAQSRINSVFAEKILGGDSCTVARDYASKLENIADGNSAPYVFGDYYLEKVGTEVGDSDVFKVNVGLISETPERTITTATLYLPECGSKSEDNEDDDVTTDDWWMKEQDLLDKYSFSKPNSILDLQHLLKLWPGLIFYVEEGSPLAEYWNLESGYYMNDLDEIPFKLSNADAEENWARYDEKLGKWDDKHLPKAGSFYKNEKGDVFLYVGESNNPDLPNGGVFIDKFKGWIKLTEYKSP